MRIYLGKTSTGEAVTKGLGELEGLFVTYSYDTQWNYFLNQCFRYGDIEKYEVVRVITGTRIEVPGGNKTLHSLQQLWEYVNKKITFCLGNNLILIFDNLFLCGIFTTGKKAAYFLKLLIRGPRAGVYFVLGTTFPFRGLFKELFRTAQIKQSHLTFYSELVINEDDLYFFRKKGAVEYERLF